MNVDLILEAVRTVEQARSGDQVAMALIEGVRHSAAEGSARAKATAAIMTDYIRNHPTDDFGEDDNDVVIPKHLIRSIHTPAESLVALHTLRSFPSGAELSEAALVHGALLTQERVSAMANPLQHPERQAFFRGFAYPKVQATFRLSVALEGWRDVGRCVAIARLVQAFIRGVAPVSSFAPNVAWELGEDVDPEDEDDNARSFRKLVLAPTRPKTGTTR